VGGPAPRFTHRHQPLHPATAAPPAVAGDIYTAFAALARAALAADPAARVVVVVQGAYRSVGAGQPTPPEPALPDAVEPADQPAVRGKGRRLGRCPADIVILLGRGDLPYGEIVNALLDSHADSTIKKNIRRLADAGYIVRKPAGVYGLPEE
jgi:hypothetical protein